MEPDDWVPEAGDLLWIDFDPALGNEQAGRRPALVVSPRAWNALSRRCVALPVTTRVRGWPSEVLLAPDAPIRGAVLVDQVRTLNWAARGATSAGVAGDQVLGQVRRLLAGILGLRP
jgi:mRNA interferase MazF